MFLEQQSKQRHSNYYSWTIWKKNIWRIVKCCSFLTDLLVVECVVKCVNDEFRLLVGQIACRGHAGVETSTGLTDICERLEECGCVSVCFNACVCKSKQMEWPCTEQQCYEELISTIKWCTSLHLTHLTLQVNAGLCNLISSLALSCYIDILVIKKSSMLTCCSKWFVWFKMFCPVVVNKSKVNILEFLKDVLFCYWPYSKVMLSSASWLYLKWMDRYIRLFIKIKKSLIHAAHALEEFCRIFLSGMLFYSQLLSKIKK